MIEASFANYASLNCKRMIWKACMASEQLGSFTHLQHILVPRLPFHLISNQYLNEVRVVAGRQIFYIRFLPRR